MKPQIKIENARVAWVTPILGRGDKLLYMGPLLSGLKEHCSDFHVFTAEFGGNPDDAGFAITRTGSISRIKRKIGANGIPLALPLIGPAILKSLYRYRADLVVVTEFGLLTMYSLLLIKLLLRHTRVLLIIESKPITLNQGWKLQIRRWLRRWITKQTDAILTNNISGKNYLVEELRASESRILSQPYLVSDMASRISSKSQGDNIKERKPEAKVRFLYVGQLVARKGINYALDACAELIKSSRGKFHFDIVGDGEMRHKLEQQAQNSNISDHVTFHGLQPYELLETYYRNTDVFLLPTLYDYRALVSFEALTTGAAMLISIHDGGVTETVSENRNGYAFEPRNTDQLTKLMKRFVDNPETIASFSQTSLAMSKQFTLESAVNTLVSACQKALGEHT